MITLGQIRENVVLTAEFRGDVEVRRVNDGDFESIADVANEIKIDGRDESTSFLVEHFARLQIVQPADAFVETGVTRKSVDLIDAIRLIETFESFVERQAGGRREIVDQIILIRIEFFLFVIEHCVAFAFVLAKEMKGMN